MKIISLRARIISLGSVAAAVLVIVAIASPVEDHLKAKESEEKRIQQQVNGIYGILEQQAWMKDFELCMRRETGDHAVDACRQESDRLAIERKKAKD